MYKSLKKSLQTWNDNTTERQKMQHAYVIAVIVLIVIAGLVGLVNYRLSQNILAVAFAAAVLWLVNLVVWALLQSLVLLPLSGRPTTPAPRTTTRSRKR